MAQKIVGKHIVTVKSQLSRAKAEIELRAPKHIGADRFIGAALTALNKTPTLIGCSRESFFNALFLSVQAGLLPDTAMQHAHLIPFGNKVVFIPGYRGLITVAYRNPKIVFIDAAIVYDKEDDGERFVVMRGARPDLTHNPILESKGRGKIKYVYATAYLKNSPYPVFKVMNMEEIERIKKKAPSQSGPWKTDFNQMALKTVIKQLFNLLPMEEEQAFVAQVDDQAAMGVDQEIPANWEEVNLIEIIGDKPAGEPTADDKKKTKTDRMAEEMGDGKKPDEKPATTTEEKPEEKVDPELDHALLGFEEYLKEHQETIGRELFTEAQELMNKKGVTVEELNDMTVALVNSQKAKKK